MQDRRLTLGDKRKLMRLLKEVVDPSSDAAERNAPAFDDRPLVQLLEEQVSRPASLRYCQLLACLWRWHLSQGRNAELTTPPGLSPLTGPVAGAAGVCHVRPCVGYY